MRAKTKAILFATTAILALSAITAKADGPVSGYGTGSGTGGGVSSVATGPCLTGGPITSTGTIATTVSANAQTGTSYALASTDGCKLVSGSNASAQAFSLSSAATAGFTAGYGFDLYNYGAGALTLTASTSTFGNALSTLVLATGQDAYVASDGTNYTTVVSLPVMAAGTYLGNTSGASNYPTAQTFGTGVAAALGTAVSGTGSICLSSGSACSGASGFPITLGSTSVASGSTTTSVTGLSIASGSGNNLAAAGSVTAGTFLTLGAANNLTWTTRGIITSPAAGDIQLGVNSATPVAQTLQFANGAGTNIAGVDATIDASQGSGNAAQGGFNFTVGTPTTSGAGYGATISALKLTGTTGRAVFGGVIGLKAYTVSTLPTGNTGDTAYVSDATSCTFLGALAGSGSTFCPVVFNGTAWVGH